mgnify:FL=1
MQYKQRLAADILLLFVAFIWGTTFTIVKDALAHVEVFTFLAQRFVLAFIFFIPFLLFRLRYLNLRVLLQGSLLGGLLFGAYAFQTIGLKFTSASNTAFVTGLNVVFVPLLQSLFFGRFVPIPARIGALLSSIGLGALCLSGQSTLNPGDFIVILCAICIALQIIFTGRYANQNDAYWLAGIQIGVVGLLSSVTGVVKGEQILAWQPDIFWALLVCAFFASSFAFWAQTSMQRFTTPTRTSIIFCMEPVFGALYARMFGGEYLGAVGLLGAALIFLGMLMAEGQDLFRARTADT